ncbi:MAG: carbon starvation protein A [Candidatus Omnitrophota bacterium]
MSGLLLLIITVAIYFLGYCYYGNYLKRLFCINPFTLTPAHSLKDNIDYVPTKAPIVFGHHFSSIAGAGPIVGPVLGLTFGWIPVALWLIIGCVFIGAVHDFSALILSVRHKGYSIGYLIETYISYEGRQIFLTFCSIALLLVIAIFTLLVAKTFTATPPVATASLIFIALAAAFGVTIRRGVALLPATMIFLPLMTLAIYIGIRFPLDLTAIFGLSPQLSNHVWMAVLMIYIYLASVLPVWLLLQPRDYLNSYLLYALIGIGLLSVIVVNPEINAPAFNGLRAMEPTGSNEWSLFPILFVTIACGACSGFHALVASGTTSKQLNNEKDALCVGYGAMLVEGVVGILALIAVGALSQEDFFLLIKNQGSLNAFSTGLASLSQSIGLPFSLGQTLISLIVSAFILTTLDTAARLTRFTLAELALPKRGQTNPAFFNIFINRYSCTLIVIILSGYLAFSGEAEKIWPVFGASNQLLAALALLVVSVILIRQKKNFLITFIPFVFMMFISAWALIELFSANLQTKQWNLTAASLLLIIMSVLLIIQTFKIFAHGNPELAETI